MNKKILITTGLYVFLNCFGFAHAIGKPTFSIEPEAGSLPVMEITSSATLTINFTVTNNTKIPRTLAMVPIPGVTVVPTAAVSACNFPSLLKPGQSCTLPLFIRGSQVPVQGIFGGPIICKSLANGQPDSNLCSRPSAQGSLKIVVIGNNNLVNRTIANITSYTNALIFPIQPTLPSGSIPWRVKPAVTVAWKLFAMLFNGGTGIPSDIKLLSSSCGSAFNGSSFCAIVGIRDDGTRIVMQSYNGGTTWMYAPIPTLNTMGQVNNVSCATDLNGISSCLATGLYSSNLPFALQTTDSGQTWSNVTAVDFSQSTLNSVNCTVNASNTLCQITGFNASLQGPVIYVYSTTNGWTTQPLFTSGVSPNASAAALDCVSLGNSDISCLVALENNGGMVSLFKIMQTSSTYTALPVASSATQGSNITLNAISCALNSGTVFCIAAGANGGAPFILQNSDISVDSNWASAAIGSSLPTGLFNAASCSALNSQISCIAAGSDDSGTPAPILAQTTNGSSWVVPTIAGVPNLGYYNVASCSISSGAVYCFANGVNNVVKEPFSVETSGPSGTWQFSNGLTSIFTLS